MSVTLNAYINFYGQAESALNFYKDVFGGEVQISRFREYASDAMPVADQDLDNVMHGILRGENSIELMISDAPMHTQGNTGSQIQLSLSGDDETLLKSYWEKLSDGATITVPMSASPWGDTFGMLTDKYGINWMVNIVAASDRS